MPSSYAYTGTNGTDGTDGTEGSSGTDGAFGESIIKTVTRGDIDDAGGITIYTGRGGNGGRGGSGYMDWETYTSSSAGSGGDGGAASFDFSGLALGSNLSATSTGGNGGDAGYSDYGGQPGSGGDGQVTVSGNLIADLGTYSLSAIGGTGASGGGMMGMGMGGSGGWAVTTFNDNTVGIHNSTISVSARGGYGGMGGWMMGMMGMNDGFASVNFQDNVLVGTNGDDVLNLSLSSNSMSWTGFYFSGNSFNGGTGNDTLNMSLKLSSWSAGSMTLDVDLGAGTVKLNGASNTISGFENVNLAGTDGPMDMMGPSTSITLTGNASDNILSGTSYDDTISGGDGADILRGNDGADIMYGGAGNDRLNGGSGTDTMYGGSGDDTYMIEYITEVCSEESTGAGHDDGGTDTVIAAWTYGLNNFIENLTLSGTGNYDGYGNELNNRILGNDGANTLYGRDGNDYLNGGAGNDTMYGGAGNDTYVVDSGDTISEAGAMPWMDAGGIDQVTANVSWVLGDFLENLTLTGTADLSGTGNVLNNRITGNAGANTLYGNDGDDYLNGGAGNDSTYGGAGNDTYVVDNSNDVVSEESTGAGNDDGGTDLVQAGFSYTLGAFIENLTLSGTGDFSGTGNNLANRITGNDGANILSGMDGDDTLSGGNGADTLIGGLGMDKLTGGAGADIFTFEAPVKGVTKDKVLDFVSGVDHLAFHAADVGLTTGDQLDSSNFSTAATADGTTTLFVYDTTKQTLYYDTNGSRAGGLVAVATLTGVGSITADDFMFV